MGNVSDYQDNSEYDAHEGKRPGSLSQFVCLARREQCDKTQPDAHESYYDRAQDIEHSPALPLRNTVENGEQDEHYAG